jgi:hypothetical protein
MPDHVEFLVLDKTTPKGESEMSLLKKSAGAAAAIFVILWLCVASASAQVAFTGQITGTVTDTSGAVIPHASVTAQNTQTNVISQTSTSDSGAYTILSVIPGTYSLSVEEKGFKKFIRENVVVGADSVVRVDIPLQVGSTTQEITVTAAAPILKADQSDVSDTITTTQIAELPTIGRNISELMMTVPGSVHATGELYGWAENMGSDMRYGVNGVSWNNANKMLDGIDNTDVIQGTSFIVPDNDSIEEMKVTTTDYDAEFGKAEGAVIQMTTKSGTNTVHGTLFEYYRDGGLFARNPFSQATYAPHSVYNQFGGSMGGPIKKDKLFFFSSVQVFRNNGSVNYGTAAIGNTPTAAMRQGDFSAFPNYPIFDPLTGNPDGTGRTQFRDPSRATADNPLGLNIIPMNRFSTAPNNVGANLMNLMPLPNNGSGPVNNLVAHTIGTTHDSQNMARIDYNKSEKTRITGRYSWFYGQFGSPSIYGPIAGNSESNGGLSQSVLGDYSRLISPTFTADVRGGFSRLAIQEHCWNQANTADEAGLTGINTGTILGHSVWTTGLPVIYVDGPVGGYTEGGCNQWAERETPVNVTTMFTKVRGDHAVKFGTDITKVYFERTEGGGPGSLKGSYYFSQPTTADAAVDNSGLGMASALLGYTNDFVQGADYHLLNQELQWRIAWFAQDSWKATRRLTLNLGVRWEYFSPEFAPNGQKGLLENFNLNTGDFNSDLNGDKYLGVGPNYTNYDPRLGLAYRVNDKTVIRAGFGRSHALDIFGGLFAIPNSNYPTLGANEITPANFNEIGWNVANGAPPLRPPIPFPSSNLLPAPTNSYIAFYGLGKQRISYMDAWNLTIQRQLTPTSSFEIAYLGNVGHNQWNNTNPNQPNIGPGPLNPRYPYFASLGLNNQMRYSINNLTSNYSALQGDFKKTFTHGLLFNWDITWGKLMNRAEPEGGTPYPFDNNLDYAPSSLNPALTSSAEFVAQLPFGPGKRFANDVHGVSRLLIAGWSLSGILKLTSGFPYTVTTSADNLNTPYITQRPDRLGSGKLANPTANLWFDPTAFSTPQINPATGVAAFGNAARDILNGPGFTNLDVSFSKTVQLTERFKLDLRADALNSLNHVNLGMPDSNLPDPNVGQITSIFQAMREMQIGAHVIW